MQESEELKKEVISNLRACLISFQGGIAASRLNDDYSQVVGEPIPFKKLGFNSLEAFLKSVPEINLKNVNGKILVEAKKIASSNHITSLVEKQRRTGRRRSRKSQQVKRLPRPRGNRPLTIPPRFSKGGNKAKGPSPPKEAKPVLKAPQDIQAPPGKHCRPPAPSAKSTNFPQRPPPPPLFQPSSQNYVPIPPPHIPYLNPMVPSHHPPTAPPYCGGGGGVIPPLIHPQKPASIHYNNSQPLLAPAPPQFHHMSPLLRNIEPALIIKQQTAELVQQFQQMPQLKDTSLKAVNKSKSKPIQRSNKAAIFDRIPVPVPSDMKKNSYYHKLLEFIKSRDWPVPEVCLLRQKGGTVTCIVSVKFSKTGEPADMSVGEQEFTTYPDEITDPVEALEQGSKKAYETIVQITAEHYPATKDTKLILDRLAENSEVILSSTEDTKNSEAELLEDIYNDTKTEPKKNSDSLLDVPIRFIKSNKTYYNKECDRISSELQDMSLNNEDECDLFGKFIAAQLKKMSLKNALICQQKFLSIIVKERLNNLNEDLPYNYKSRTQQSSMNNFYSPSPSWSDMLPHASANEDELFSSDE